MTLKNLTQSQLAAAAKALAETLKQQPAVIGLTGPLGAGKTTFVKAFAAGLGMKRAKSPSFVIMHNYRQGRTELHHVDFYRLTKAAQLNTLGLDELFSRRHTALIEWVDKFPNLMKQCDLVINFRINNDGTRTLDIKSR